MGKALDGASQPAAISNNPESDVAEGEDIEERTERKSVASKRTDLSGAALQTSESPSKAVTSTAQDSETTPSIVKGGSQAAILRQDFLDSQPRDDHQQATSSLESMQSTRSSLVTKPIISMPTEEQTAGSQKPSSKRRLPSHSPKPVPSPARAIETTDQSFSFVEATQPPQNGEDSNYEQDIPYEGQEGSMSSPIKAATSTASGLQDGAPAEPPTYEQHASKGVSASSVEEAADRAHEAHCMEEAGEEINTRDPAHPIPVEPPTASQNPEPVSAKPRPELGSTSVGANLVTSHRSLIVPKPATTQTLASGKRAPEVRGP